MTDYNYGGTDEENAEIRRLNVEVESDTDSFETWEKLVQTCEALDGGLNRNSSPQALATMRDSYDRFLLKFPLLFGYWKKYADLEFNIAGPEAAEMVYERGCASITSSVDLWTEFCTFKMETTHVPQPVRDLFERAASHIGLDFLAHPFWDKYLEYEERLEAKDNIFAILKRLIKIPLHQYARYYERFRLLAQSRQVSDVVSPDTLAQLQAEVDAEAAQYGAKTPAELDTALRTKIDALYYDVFTKTQAETTKRWTFESEIKRPYFHVTELDHSQLANWRKYLDFEEDEGDHERVVVLYERCLVTCAFYDEFWFRYARWMEAQDGKAEDTRNIYLRASALFVPVSRPGIRLRFAFFEESCGRIDMARAIHEAVLDRLPNSVEVILSWAHLERRQGGLDAAIDVLKQQIDQPGVDLYTKAALVTEWADLLWKVKGSVADARSVFEANVQWYRDSREFWQKWFDFELAQTAVPAVAAADETADAMVDVADVAADVATPASTSTATQNNEDESEAKEAKVKDAKDTKENGDKKEKPQTARQKQAARIDAVFQDMRLRSRLSTAAKKDLTKVYLSFLQQQGEKDAAKKFLQIEREMFGPASVSFFAKHKSQAKENGVPIVELDEATLQKAEARYAYYYEEFSEPSPAAQGPAAFD